MSSQRRESVKRSLPETFQIPKSTSGTDVFKSKENQELFSEPAEVQIADGRARYFLAAGASPEVHPRARSGHDHEPRPHLGRAGQARQRRREHRAQHHPAAAKRSPATGENAARL